MIYTADLFRKDCKTLAEQVSGFDFTHILSVERGGGYVVDQLSHHIKNKIYFVVPIHVSFYDGKQKRHTPYVDYWAGKIFGSKDKVLIVDDLLDTGETIQYIINHPILEKASDVKVAVMIKKPTSAVEPDFCIHRNITSWIQFFWEDANGNHICKINNNVCQCH